MQPMPTMEAVYLIEPSESSIAKIKEDFADQEKSMYAGAHVYVTSHLPNDLVYSLKQVLLAPNPAQLPPFSHPSSLPP